MRRPIERVGPGAAGGLARTHAACFERPWSATEFASLLHLAGVTGLRLGPAREPAGLALARGALDEAEILTLGIVPARRCRGDGSALLEALERVLAGTGMKRIFLEVSVTNAPARRLYERAGYRPVGHRPAYYADGADALVLEKWLSGDGQHPA